MEDQEQPNGESTADQNQKPKKKESKLEACLDCVKNGVSTGLKDAEHLCETCEGSGSVTVV